MEKLEEIVNSPNHVRASLAGRYREAVSPSRTGGVSDVGVGSHLATLARNGQRQSVHRRSHAKFDRPTGNCCGRQRALRSRSTAHHRKMKGPNIDRYFPPRRRGYRPGSHAGAIRRDGLNAPGETGENTQSRRRYLHSGPHPYLRDERSVV